MNKIDLDLIKKEAQSHFQKQEFSCAESVLKALVDNFDIIEDKTLVKVASPFSGGLGGLGCVCGTLSAANIAIGLTLGRYEANDPKIDKAKELSQKIYNIFVEENKTACCREVTRGLEPDSEEKRERCYPIIGNMAYNTAKLIADELKIEY